MSDDDRIWFVQRRFDELRELLELAGWPVVERGGIDSTEIIDTVHARRPPMVPVDATLRL